MPRTNKAAAKKVGVGARTTGTRTTRARTNTARTPRSLRTGPMRATKTSRVGVGGDGRGAGANSPNRRATAWRTVTARAASTKAHKRSPMTEEHKAALAAGRAEGRAVRNYLEALEKHRPRRGRRRTPDTISRRLAAVENQLESADALARLHLLKEKADLEAELARASSTDDVAVLEKSFVSVARRYGQRKGITYSVWRAAGVSSSVLQRAGVIRGGGRGRF